jgi:hypothetical protein
MSSDTFYFVVIFPTLHSEFLQKEKKKDSQFFLITTVTYSNLFFFSVEFLGITNAEYFLTTGASRNFSEIAMYYTVSQSTTAQLVACRLGPQQYPSIS